MPMGGGGAIVLTPSLATLLPIITKFICSIDRELNNIERALKKQKQLVY